MDYCRNRDTRRAVGLSAPHALTSAPRDRFNTRRLGQRPNMLRKPMLCALATCRLITAGRNLMVGIAYAYRCIRLTVSIIFIPG